MLNTIKIIALGEEAQTLMSCIIQPYHSVNKYKLSNIKLFNYLLGLTVALGGEGEESFLLVHSSSHYSTYCAKRAVVAEALISYFQVESWLEGEVGALAHLKEVVVAKELILEVQEDQNLALMELYWEAEEELGMVVLRRVEEVLYLEEGVVALLLMEVVGEDLLVGVEVGEQPYLDYSLWELVEGEHLFLELMMVRVEVVHSLFLEVAHLLFLVEGVEDPVSFQEVVWVDLSKEEWVMVLNLTLMGVVAMAWSFQILVACWMEVGVVEYTQEAYWVDLEVDWGEVLSHHWMSWNYLGLVV